MTSATWPRVRCCAGMHPRACRTLPHIAGLDQTKDDIKMPLFYLFFGWFLICAIQCFTLESLAFYRPHEYKFFLYQALHPSRLNFILFLLFYFEGKLKGPYITMPSSNLISFFSTCSTGRCGARVTGAMYATGHCHTGWCDGSVCVCGRTGLPSHVHPGPSCAE